MIQYCISSPSYPGKCIPEFEIMRFICKYILKISVLHEYFGNAMTSLFQYSTSSSSVAIFQHHQHMEFTFHNSQVILEIVASTVIFWTELSCLRTKFYGRHHNLVARYEISISQMTIGLLLFTQMFSFLYYCQDILPDLTVYVSNTAGVL